MGALEVQVLLVFLVAASSARIANAIDFCSSLVLLHGYPCLQYQVTTEDGYILSLNRIPHGSKSPLQQAKKAVFLQHGVLQGGDIWVYDPHQSALGFMLADQGYDVWIGNLRGTRWSLGHIKYSYAQKVYWEWSWDEHAIYDLPAMLNFAYKTSGSKLNYIAHSLGTLIGVASFSGSNAVNVLEKVILMCPIAYLNGSNSIISKIAATVFLDKAVDLNGQFTMESGLGAQVIKTACSINPRCTDILTLVTGPNCCFNNTLTSYYQRFEPQGTSTKNMVHLAQMVRTGKLGKFDYILDDDDPTMGPMPYGSPTPRIPSTLPVMLAYGGLDTLSTPPAVFQLASKLRCTYKMLYVPHYGHVDFIMGTTAAADVYMPILDFLKA